MCALPSWLRGCASSRALPAAAAIAALVVSWVLMGELIQGLQSGWPCPWFITYTIHASYATTLVPYSILHARRTGALCCGRCRVRPAAAAAAESDNAARPAASPTHLLLRTRTKPAVDVHAAYPVSLRQLFALAMVLQALSCLNGFTWYLSLPLTLVAANNSIYQSASAIVFIFSLFVLGEMPSWRKAASVVVCIVGVVLVSTAPTAASSAVHQTLGGYLWVIASTVGYSAYEVIYARFTQQRVRRATDICTRYVSPHAVEERAAAAAAAATAAASLTAGGINQTGGDGDSDAPAQLPDDAILASLRGSPVLTPVSRTARARRADGAAASDDEDAAAQRLLEEEDAADEELALPSARASSGGGGAVSTALQAEMAALMLGVMGVLTLLVMWPIFFIFNATGVEDFVWPPREKVNMLILSAFLDTVYNVSFLFGIQITNPLWISVGTVLVVPGSLIADWLIHHTTVLPQAAVGIVLIICGFIILQFSPHLLVHAWRALVGFVSRSCRCARRRRRRSSAGGEEQAAARARAGTPSSAQSSVTAPTATTFTP